MNIVDNTVTFRSTSAYNPVIGTFTNSGEYITIYIRGRYVDKPEFYHTYELKIN